MPVRCLYWKLLGSGSLARGAARLGSVSVERYNLLPWEPTTFMFRGYTVIMGILATPPKATPPRNKALLRAY